MGCDIHIIAEVKEKGVWRKNTDKVFKNPYYEMYKDVKEEDPDRYKALKNIMNLRKFMEEPSSNRDYRWFSVLADVRNYGFNPIAEPKGFPKDASRDTMMFLGMVVDDNMTMEEYEKTGGEIDLGNGNYKYKYPREKILEWECKYLDEEETIAKDIDYHSYSYFTAKELAEFDWNQVIVFEGEEFVYKDLFKDNLKLTVEPLKKLSMRYEDARIVFAFDN